VRSIISKLNQGSQGFDPKELDDLTKDLIQYQKDYAELEHSKDKVNTLKMIKESNSKKLGLAKTMFNVYVVIFICLAFVVAYLVFKTEWIRRITSILPTALQQWHLILQVLSIAKVGQRV